LLLVVYYHDGKPRWNEVVRILVPVEMYHQVNSGLFLPLSVSHTGNEVVYFSSCFLVLNFVSFSKSVHSFTFFSYLFVGRTNLASYCEFKYG